MRVDRPQIWLRIDTFGQPMGFELRVGDNAYALALEDVARLTDIGEWLTALAVDSDHVPTLIEAVAKLQVIARALDERARPTQALAPAIGEPADTEVGSEGREQASLAGPRAVIGLSRRAAPWRRVR